MHNKLLWKAHVNPAYVSVWCLYITRISNRCGPVCKVAFTTITPNHAHLIISAILCTILGSNENLTDNWENWSPQHTPQNNGTTHLELSSTTTQYPIA